MSMIEKLFFGCLIICFFPSCERQGPASEIIQERRPRPYHIVKAGETTLSIAQKYKMREDELIQLNKLKSPYVLVPGQRLIVKQVKENGDPSTPTAATAKEEEVSVKPLMPEGSSFSSQTGESGFSAGQTVARVGSATAGLIGATSAGASAASSSASSPPSSVPEATVAPTPAYDWPAKGTIVQDYGQKLSDGNISDGINLSVASNTPVKAVADGVVSRITPNVVSYGNLAVVKHADGSMSLYGHLKDFAVQAKQKISKGTVIGTAGNTGIANAKSEPLLFFQMRDANLNVIDPKTVLPPHS